MNQRKLVGLNKQYAVDGLSLIGICCDHDLLRAKAFMHDEDITWPQYWDGRMWAGKMNMEWGHPRIGCVLIGPDGVVLWLGPVTLLEKEIEYALTANPPTIIDPAELTRASDQLDQVDKALAAKDFAAALTTFAAVPADDSANKTIRRRVTDLQPKLTDAVKQVLGPVDDLIAHRNNLDALSRLHDLNTTLKGTLAAPGIDQRMQSLMADPKTATELAAVKKEKDAETALAGAAKLTDSQHVGELYLRLKSIIADYPDTHAAQRAKSQVAEIEADPKRLALANRQIADVRADALLDLAKSYTDAGRDEPAKQKYQELIRTYPDSPQAQTAGEAITKLNR